MNTRPVLWPGDEDRVGNAVQRLSFATGDRNPEGSDQRSVQVTSLPDERRIGELNVST